MRFAETTSPQPSATVTHKAHRKIRAAVNPVMVLQESARQVTGYSKMRPQHVERYTNSALKSCRKSQKLRMLWLNQSTSRYPSETRRIVAIVCAKDHVTASPLQTDNKLLQLAGKTTGIVQHRRS